MTEHTIGIDISKSHLDVFQLEDAATSRFENSQRGLKALTEWLDATPVEGMGLTSNLLHLSNC